LFRKITRRRIHIIGRPFEKYDGHKNQTHNKSNSKCRL